jgi:hypothetical protein
LACECARWSEPSQHALWDDEADDGTQVTLASLRYASLPDGVAQWMTLDDAVIETIERLHDYDDRAPGCEAFLRDLLQRVRLWSRFELWAVLTSGDVGADDLLAQLCERDANRERRIDDC